MGFLVKKMRENGGKMVQSRLCPYFANLVGVTNATHHGKRHGFGISLMGIWTRIWVFRGMLVCFLGVYGHVLENNACQDSWFEKSI